MLKKFVLIIILVSSWPLGALAESQGLTIAGLLETSGANKQIEAIPKSLKIGLRRGLSRGVPNPDKKLQQVFKRVENAIDKAYEKDKMMGMLQQRVKGAFSPEELNSLNAFLESPLGKRITEAENKMVEEKEIENIMQNSTKNYK